MKTWLWRGTLAVGIALLALSGAARADRDHNDRCTKATLKGDYAFSVTTWTLPPSQIWTPGFVIGLTTFSGKGDLTQIDFPAGSALADFRRGQTGTYTVNEDCTGRATVNLNIPGPGVSHGVIDLAFVISNGGRSIHGVVSKLIPPGASAPGNIIDRVDFWKVGSEDED
jgi:hypothetical protein